MKLFGGKRRASRSGKRAAAQPTENTPAASGKKGKLTGLQKGLLMLAGSLAVLAGVVYGVYKAFVRPMDIVSPTVQADDSAKKVTKITSIDEKTGKEVELEFEVPGSHKKGYYNILVVGTDGDGTRTDTIMVARLNTNDHTVALMSIPRDTLINASYSVPKINSVYGANGKGEKGITALKKYVTATVGFEVDGYVLVDLKAFQKIVDEIGGVTFNVPQRMYYNDPSQDLYIDLNPGEQLLNGKQAMGLCRFRKYAEADIQRTRVQQDFLRALAKQVLKVGNLTKIQSFAQIFHDYVLTDLSVGNMIYFGKELMNCDFDNMKTFTLPGEGVSIRGGSYYALYANQVLKIVNENFNPYDADIPLGNLNIRGGKSGSGSYQGNTSSGSSGSHSSSSSSGSSGSKKTTEKPAETTMAAPETTSPALTEPEPTAVTETAAETGATGTSTAETGGKTTVPETTTETAPVLTEPPAAETTAAQS